MKLKDLPVGSKFVIVREHEPQSIYTKIDFGRYNAIYKNQRLVIHSLTEVKEIK